ncbi:DUF692 domain-containing protein [Litorivita sp. NS0012-18]|uniref:MNIO family bufferin maturase n=1 Tax=Litorivita sp. NS0012-18 TaxID=3127655 RepID=UPI0031043DEC
MTASLPDLPLSPDAAPLPLAAGIGYKPQHFEALMKDAGAVSWLEIHAENYMGDGGRPLAQLRALAERFAISVHGVGLSIGGQTPLDTAHLARLARLCDHIKPASFSEHLAWSTHGAEFMNDLLPLPYTAQTLAHVCDHIDQVQNALGRQMLLENPSSYLAFAQSTYAEPEFLCEVVRRSGCAMLLDVNNVFVSAQNLDLDPIAYLDAYPIENVQEIHLGGHDEDFGEGGKPLLIDSHGAPVADPVWALLDEALQRSGPRPTLVEWDNDVPEFKVLEAEAQRAAAALRAASHIEARRA